MSKHYYWFKFEWAKWRNDPQLRRCSKETRGFWIDCIAAMEELDTYKLEGTPDELCRELFCTRKEFDRSIAELGASGAATITKSRTRVTIVSRKILKEVSVTEYNKLRKRKSRGHTVVTPQEQTVSKDIEDLEDSSYEESKETYITGGEVGSWEWPMQPFVEAFPEYLSDRITPTMIGFIESNVLPGDEEAWRRTIEKYQMNFKPELNRYLPDKISNVIDVFRKYKAEGEQVKNGSSKSNNRSKSDPEKIAESAEFYANYESHYPS
jgi:hypothetical protein